MLEGNLPGVDRSYGRLPRGAKQGRYEVGARVRVGVEHEYEVGLGSFGKPVRSSGRAEIGSEVLILRPIEPCAVRVADELGDVCVLKA